MDLTLLALAKGYTDKQIEKAAMSDIQIDQTLTKEGFAADAKAVGEAIENIELTPGPQGDSGVYVGASAPTDESVNVWINPNGEAIDIPSGGGEGGNNTFYYELTLEEDLNVVNIPFPVNWEKILQFNIHMITDLPADMAMETFTGTGWAKHGTLPAGLKGLNIYGITYAWDTYSTIVGIDVSTGGVAHDLAMPKFATQGRLAQRAGNTLGLYSTTDGAKFPTGTKFDVWGVYAP